jgi:hypothetical protein
LSQEGKKVFLIFGKKIRLNVSQILIALSVLDFIKNVFDELDMMMGFGRERFLLIENRLLDGGLDLFVDDYVKLGEFLHSLLGK